MRQHWKQQQNHNNNKTSPQTIMSPYFYIIFIPSKSERYISVVKYCCPSARFRRKNHFTQNTVFHVEIENIFNRHQWAIKTLWLCLCHPERWLILCTLLFSTRSYKRWVSDYAISYFARSVIQFLLKTTTLQRWNTTLEMWWEQKLRSAWRKTKPPSQSYALLGWILYLCRRTCTCSCKWTRSIP